MTREQFQKMEELYQTALSLSPEERSRFLTLACSGDIELLEAVASLLVSNEKAGSFLAKNVFEMGAGNLLDESHSDLTGHQIGHYRVLSLLGAGGMGEVYLAQDTRLRRKVGIKLLPATFAKDTDRLRRFVQEAQAASALNHPNIITIYEIGEEQGTHYIVTEFIEGRTLRQQMNDGQLTLSDALDVAVQAASALAAAHQAGIVHRDIKPENIMTRSDGLVKVLDFGLAKLTKPVSADINSQADTIAHSLTGQGMILGTLRYMSPEQARGLEVDPRTDIFSLGVVLYEMVTGDALFTGATASDVIAAILTAACPPLVPPAPIDLQHIVSHALLKDRDERYQTASALLSDLKKLKQRLEFASASEAGLPLSFANDSRPFVAGSGLAMEDQATIRLAAMPGDQSAGQQIAASSGQSFLRRFGKYKIILAGVVAALLLASLALYQFKGREGEIESIAVLPLVNVSGDQELDYLSDGLAEAVIGHLAQLPGLKVMSRASSFRYRARDVDPREVGRVLQVNTVLLGLLTPQSGGYTIKLELVNALDGRQLWSEQYQRNLLDMLTTPEEITQSVARRLQLKLRAAVRPQATPRQSSNPEAYQAYLRGRLHYNRFTKEELERGIEYFQKVIALDKGNAPAYASLAQAYAVLGGNYSQADEFIPKAREYAQEAARLDDTLPDAHYVLAQIAYIYDWNWQEAERQLRRTIELNPNHALAFSLFGQLRMTFGYTQDGIGELKRAVRLDPLSTLINYNLARAYYYARQYQETVEQSQKTLELDQNAIFVSFLLSEAYAQQGRYAEALAAVEKTRPAAQEDYGFLPTIAYVHAVSGKRAEAYQVLKQIQQRQYVPMFEVAKVYAALQEKDETFAWLNKAVQTRPAALTKIKVMPIFDFLRTDQRYQDLLRQMKITP